MSLSQTIRPFVRPRGLAAGSTVFLVDRDEAVRDALGASLGAAGLRVVALSSTAHLLAAARGDSGACIVLDVDPLDRDGHDVLRIRRALDTRLPMIATSARLMTNGLGETLASSAVRLLEKPFGEDELLDLIRSVLQDPAEGPPGPCVPLVRPAAGRRALGR